MLANLAYASMCTDIPPDDQVSKLAFIFLIKRLKADSPHKVGIIGTRNAPSYCQVSLKMYLNVIFGTVPHISAVTIGDSFPVCSLIF